MTTHAAVTARHPAPAGPRSDRPESRTGLTGPTIRRHRLGLELRRLREAAGLRLEDAAAELGVAPSTLSRIETGQAPARTSYVRVLLDRYGLTGDIELRELTDLAREGQRKGWWADHDKLLPVGTGTYLGLEAAASVSRTFAVQVIPGLLRTSDYAAAVCRATRPDLSLAAIRAHTAVTLRRPDFLRKGHQMHAILDESALLRSVGTTSIMTAQLAHLRNLAASSSFTVQIATLSRTHGVLSAPFTILTFPDPANPDVACRVGSDGQVALIRRATAVSGLRSTFDALAAAGLSADESASLISEVAGSR
jgi:transcriptional regulator with XRE-family HTH domain